MIPLSNPHKKNSVWQVINIVSENNLKLLLIPNFFAHPALDDRNNPEYGTDSAIEFDEDELYRCYNEFFHDIIAEFESFGLIRYIFVCRNHAVHLRGTVFIQYDSVRLVMISFDKFKILTWI